MAQVNSINEEMWGQKTCWCVPLRFGTTVTWDDEKSTGLQCFHGLYLHGLYLHGLFLLSFQHVLNYMDHFFYGNFCRLSVNHTVEHKSHLQIELFIKKSLNNQGCTFKNYKIQWYKPVLDISEVSRPLNVNFKHLNSK